MKRLEALSETELIEFEAQLEELKQKHLSVEEQIALIEQLAEPLDDPESGAEFEEVIQRRPLFGGRVPLLEPDNET